MVFENHMVDLMTPYETLLGRAIVRFLTKTFCSYEGESYVFLCECRERMMTNDEFSFFLV